MVSSRSIDVAEADEAPPPWKVGVPFAIGGAALFGYWLATADEAALLGFVLVVPWGALWVALAYRQVRREESGRAQANTSPPAPGRALVVGRVSIGRTFRRELILWSGDVLFRAPSAAFANPPGSDVALGSVLAVGPATLCRRDAVAQLWMESGILFAARLRLRLVTGEELLLRIRDDATAIRLLHFFAGMKSD